MATSPTQQRRARPADEGPPAVETVRGEVVERGPATETEARVKEALREGKTALWKLAEALYDFDRQKGWESLGYESLNRWLEDPEIDMTRGTYYRLVRTWGKLAIEKKIAPKQLTAVDMSKAALVADDVVEGNVRPATALRDVQSMSSQQLREKYEKPRRGRPPKGEATAGHKIVVRSDALKAAAELPWDLLEQAVKGRSADLNQARLREAIPVFLAWRAEYLT